MAEVSHHQWRNLQICKVEDAGTMWVREVPSHASSKELLQFLEMEKQMNDYFNNRQSCNSWRASHITVGHPVVICYKDRWRRGKVERLPHTKDDKISVFLVDYGFVCQTSLEALIPVSEEKWNSVPRQARKVVLHGVVPISLQYAFINQEYRLILKRCKHWDTSATEYVKLLSSKKPLAEFTPIRFSPEGCSWGKLVIILPEEMWLPILPKSSQDKLLQTEYNQMALDLAQLLVDYQFAQSFQGMEEEICKFSSECGQAHPNTSEMSVSMEAASSDSIRDVDIVAAHEVPGRLCSGSDLCITKGTSSYQNTPTNSDHWIRAGGIDVDQSGSELKSPSNTFTCDPQSLHTRMDTEEKLKLNYNNDSDETVSESKEECSDNVVHYEKDSMNMTPLGSVTKDCLLSTSTGKTEVGPGLAYNRLPLNTEVIVEVTELVSAEEFYVVQRDNLQDLDNLEDEINELHDYLDCWAGEKRSDNGCVASKPAIGSPCIAKFTDNKYYRGQVKAAENDGTLTVFYVDHGETVKIPEQQIHACTRAWVEYMPGQAIRCTLAHITIPPYLSQAARQTMTHIMDVTDSWIVKALEVKDDNGPLYVVELTEDASDSPLEVWKYLVCQGVAFMDSENASNGGDDETSELFITSNLDDEELTNFFFGITAIKQQETKQKEVHNGTTVELDEKESNPSCISGAGESHLIQENAPDISKRKEKEGKNVVNSDKTESNTMNCENVDAGPDTKNKTTKEKFCSMKTNSEEQLSCKEVKESLNLKEKDQDIHKRVTLESRVFDMKRLGMPPLSAVDGVTQRLTPDTSWSQKEDTVHISIHLVGVMQYKCRVSSTHLIFMSVLGDKFYVLDDELCQKVITESSVVSVQGICVSITLKKVVKGKWTNVFKDRRHRPWLRVDYKNLSLEEDSSETEDYDDDGWREVMNHSKKPATIGGLAGGISSDSDSTTDTELF